MSPPEQLFQLRTTEHAPVLQRDPVNTRPIRRRHNALSLQQLAKALRPGSKRQHRPPILVEIELREHLAAILLRPHPPTYAPTYAEDELVAPPPGFATRLDNVR